MIKIFAAFTVLTVIISTAAVYGLKQTTYDLEERKRDISAQILKDREAIKVLKAEMAYLSRPERLERLSRRHLVLDSTQNEQMVLTAADLSKREAVQVASMPIDNFQLLLPRQKPEPGQVLTVNTTTQRSSNVTTVSFADEVKKDPNVENQKEQKSLYERILAKISR